MQQHQQHQRAVARPPVCAIHICIHKLLHESCSCSSGPVCVCVSALRPIRPIDLQEMHSVGTRACARRAALPLPFNYAADGFLYPIPLPCYVCTNIPWRGMGEYTVWGGAFLFADVCLWVFSFGGTRMYVHYFCSALSCWRAITAGMRFAEIPCGAAFASLWVGLIVVQRGLVVARL